MSDNENEIDYVPPPVESIAAIDQAVRGSSFSGYSYVAEPAAGWDTDGIWVSFATAFRSGYSVHSMAAAYGLSEGCAIPTQLVPHRHVDIDPSMFPDDRRTLYDKWHEGKIGRAHLLVAGYPPIEAAYLRGIAANMICYTAHEATRVSQFVVNTCNENFEEIWVVSDFCRRAFLDSGVRPELVRTVSPMLYGGPWKQTLTDPAKHTGAYRFGTQGTWHSRKGMLDLVRSYYRAFSASDDVVLEIRTSQMGGRLLTVKEMLAKIGEEIRQEKSKFDKVLPKIVVNVGTESTDQQVLDWFHTLDCYVNPSYGEGLGIPPLWAAMAGIPVVTSTFGAVGEYFVARGSLFDRFVPHRLERVDPSMPSLSRSYDFDQEWGMYDIADFGSAMRSAFEAGRQFDLAGAVAVCSRFSLDQMIVAMRPALAKYLPEKMRG